ncbi:OmpH family outer membrane protein [Haemophilus sp. oral taxon 851]|uniref:OmpH family outer membrane protein n=1 Tax=Haemophilus sp. oral taxon 851 TaxID=762964 RepID=UPI0002462387|nr:OmpH family outer membrane protein [Haemophilus sp. oral taxon 851]EHO48962.1 outer membrane protein [Haemophilus sp. oral taxon 851 str. F0397]
MKNIAKVTALALGIALASGYAAAEEKIAFINAGYIFQNHPDRQAVADKLDAEFKPVAEKLAASKKEVDDKIAAARKKVEAKVAALEKDAPRLRQADIQKRQEEINKLGAAEDAELQKLMQEQDKKVQEFQAQNEKRQAEERGKLLDSIQTATNNLAKAKGYTYVLDANSVVFAVEGKDITEEVLKSIPASEKSAPAKAEEKK